MGTVTTINDITSALGLGYTAAMNAGDDQLNKINKAAQVVATSEERSLSETTNLKRSSQ